MSSSRGVAMKDILDYLLPELNPASLKQGLSSQKTSEQLLKLDEQGVSVPMNHNLALSPLLTTLVPARTMNGRILFCYSVLKGSIFADMNRNNL